MRDSLILRNTQTIFAVRTCDTVHLFHVIAVTVFGTPACLPVIFQKGNNFGAVLFASLDDLAHPKWPFSDRTF